MLMMMMMTMTTTMMMVMAALHRQGSCFFPLRRNILTYMGVNYLRYFRPSFALCIFRNLAHVSCNKSLWDTWKFCAPKGNMPLASRYWLMLRTHHPTASTAVLSGFSLAWNLRAQLVSKIFEEFKMCWRLGHIFPWWLL